MIDLLNELEAHNISVFVEGNDLKLSYEGDTLDTRLLEKVKEHKKDMIAFLQKYSQSYTYTDIPLTENKENYPLSSSQYRIWLLSSSEEASISYNVPNYFELKGSHNISFLIKAVECVVDRHETLRTVFKEDHAGNMRQWVLSREDIGFTVTYKDCREIDNNDEFVKKHIENDAATIFNLEKGPLLRVYIYQLADNHLILYCNIHHIISDTWSLGVLTKDILTYYKAFFKNENPDLPKLRIQYKDYVLWHNEQINAEKLKNHKNFWLSTFVNEVPILDLPTHLSRPKIKTFNGVNLETYLSEEITLQLNTYCNKQGVSLFMSLLAVWNILFYKYTGLDDIIIGTAVAGRDHLDLKDQVGCFINTLALRNKLDTTDDFNTFCEKLKDRTLEVYEHQIYPFDQLIKELKPKKNLSRGVLFDVMFLLQNAVENDNTQIIESHQANTIVSNGSKGVISDLDITIREVGKCLKLDVVYNTDVYERDMMERLIKHYKQLLEALLQNPDTAIESVNYLTNTERSVLIDNFNETAIAYPENQTILDVFKRQVAETPDNVAVVFQDKALTYMELDRASNKLSNYLIDKGVGVAQMVPIYIERSVDMVIGILGVLKAGAAYVPIDPSCPEERIKYILNDTSASLIISQLSLKETLEKESSASIVCLDQREYINTSEKVEPLKLEPQNLIYVIYTSGTTGKPKGVLIEHGGFFNLAMNQITFFKVESSTSALQFASIGFDASCSEIFTCLLAGGTLVIPSKEAISDSSKMIQFIKKHRINLATIPPSYQAVITDELSNMKSIVSAGENLNTSVTKVLQDQGVRVINAYGPTENSVCATMTETPIQTNGVISIGKPIGNTQIYILDKVMNIVPIGVIGEICLAGKQVARGYHNQPELTEEKFIPNPFSLEVNSKLYRTGDLGRWLFNGTIEFIGRKDDQVKIRGYRVELKEIQNTIVNLENVDQAIVLVKEELNRKYIIAYIIGKGIASHQVEEKLKKFLPDYMIPSHFVFLKEMPLTTNGKVDHKALLALDRLKKSNVKCVNPITDKEKILIQSSKEVLMIDGISMLDNFYGIGGDSIKSIQLISKLKKYGYKLKARDVLRSDNFKALAILLSKDIDAVNQEGIVGNVLLTPIQKYFFKDPSFVIHHHYNQSVILKSKARIENQALSFCLKHLVAHHDALRTVYYKKNGLWIQYTNAFSEACFSIEFYDLQEEENPLESMSKLAGSIQSSINLEQGPLFKIGHFRLEDGDRLVLIIHHLVVDGVSWRILLMDLALLFKQYKADQKLILPLKTNSYKDWALLQHQYAQGNNIKQEKEYWQSICNNTVKKLPQDIKSTNAIMYYDSSSSFILDKSTTKILQSGIDQNYQIEINAIMISALGMAIKETFSSQKTIIKLEGHGREDSIGDIDISRTVGWFTTIYPFLLDASKASNSLETVLQINKALKEIPNKGIGYGILNYLTDTSLTAINASIEFNYLGDFGSSIDGQNTSTLEYAFDDIGDSIDQSNGNMALLSIIGMMSFNQLELSIRFSKSVYKEETIEKLAKSYKGFLKEIIKILTSENALEHLTSGIKSKPNVITKPNVYALSENQKIFVHKKQSHGILKPIKVMQYSEHQFQEVFREFLEKHSFLRVHLESIEGNSIQKVESSENVTLGIKVKKDFVDSQFLETQQEVLEYFHLPYDLFNGELIRLFIVPDQQGNAFVFVSIHHVLTDMYTNEIIGNRLQEHCNNKNLEYNFTTNFDLEKWQSKFFKSAEGVESKKFWQQKLGGLSYFKSKAKETYLECITESVVILGTSFDHLKERATNYGVPLNAIIMQAHQNLLRVLKTEGKLFQLVITDGREIIDSDIDMNNLLGVVCNFLPIPIEPVLEINELEHINKIYDNYIEARIHQSIPYEEIRTDVMNKRDVDIDTCIAGIFNFQMRNDVSYQLDNKALYLKTENKNDYTKGIDLTCIVYKNAIEISLTTHAELYKGNSQIAMSSFLDKELLKINENSFK